MFEERQCSTKINCQNICLTDQIDLHTWNLVVKAHSSHVALNGSKNIMLFLHCFSTSFLLMLDSESLYHTEHFVQFIPFPHSDKIYVFYMIFSILQKTKTDALPSTQ